MSEVKWIKITTDIFDDEKIALIEGLPDADAIIVIWFKLLCFAGKQNNGGVFLMNDRVAYTDKMLATIFRRKETVVQMALKTFEEFGMVEIVDGVITIPNWGKHQNLDRIEKSKDYMRRYMADYRKKQKSLVEGSKTNSKTNSKVNSKTNVNNLEEDIEEEIEEEIDKEYNSGSVVSSGEETPKPPFHTIVEMYNGICKSYPRVVKLSERRKSAIKARLKDYTLEDFRTVFEKAEASRFLRGANKNDWSATFDWMIADANMAKVLDGNYDDDRGGVKGGRHSGADTGSGAGDRWNLQADVE